MHPTARIYIKGILFLCNFLYMHIFLLKMIHEITTTPLCADGDIIIRHSCASSISAKYFTVA